MFFMLPEGYVYKKSNRTIGIAEFNKSLDPNLSELERSDELYKFLYDTNFDYLLNQLHFDDYSERVTAFVESLDDAIITDEEPWRKKGEEIFGSLYSGNVEHLFVALCGWGAKNLARRAMILPDDDYRFHKEDERGELIVYWRDGKTTRTKCKVDAGSFGVWGYSSDVFKHPNDNEMIERVEIEVAPISEDTYNFCCYSKAERDKRGDDSLYWYTPDPNKKPTEYEK